MAAKGPPGKGPNAKRPVAKGPAVKRPPAKGQGVKVPNVKGPKVAFQTLKKTTTEDDGEESEDTVKYEGPKVGDVIHERYTILRQLGEGGFGAVFQVIDSKTDKYYAVKVELKEPPEDDPGLPMEAQVLKRLQGYQHVLRYVDEGRWGPNKISYLIMQLAGPSLESYRKKRPQGSLSPSTTTRLAIQCFDGISQMHTVGFLHRDIKPGNFAMGEKGTDARNVFILDFGLVRRFMKNGRLRPKRPAVGFRGSEQYASINAHKNIDLGRCDDYLCWLYTMVQLRSGKLPWRNYSGIKKVGMVKMKTTKNELLVAMEPEYHKIYDNLITLKYEDSPPVRMYREQLVKIVERLNVLFSDPYDWETPDKTHVDVTITDKKAVQVSPQEIKPKETVETEKPIQQIEAKKTGTDNLQQLGHANFMFDYINPQPNKITDRNVQGAKFTKQTMPKLTKQTGGPRVIFDAPVKQAINKMAAANQGPVTVSTFPTKVTPQKSTPQDVNK